MDSTYQVRDDKHSDDEHSDHDHSDEDYYSFDDWHGKTNQMCCPYMNYSQNMCGCPYMSKMMHCKPMKMGREFDEPDDEDMSRQRPPFYPYFYDDYPYNNYYPYGHYHHHHHRPRPWWMY